MALSGKHAWVAIGAAVALGALPHGAAAQPVAPEVSLRADADEVELGDSITVTLTAMSDASTPQPGDPQLRTPKGWNVTGPMISTQTQMSIVNGRVSQRAGFRAMWQVVPSTTGTFEVGPASFSLSGQRSNAGVVKVTVVAPSGGARKPKRKRSSDPFGGLFGPLFDMDEPPAPAAPAPANPQLSLDAPLEAQAFIRAVIDKTRAMVGEQVTLSLYLYSVPRAYQVVDPHEPSAPDFFQRVISNGEPEEEAVNVGGSRWKVRLIRKVALFPLRAGELGVGPMTVTLLGPGFRGSGLRGGLVRASAPLVVQVEEPPLKPRPKGYVLGDVGSFNLQAQVEPRKVEAGGSVAVTAVIRGTGNPPSTLRLPEQKGVAWLEPETREAIDAHDSVVSGSRGFTYIVRLTEPGTVDLGELSASFWNPKLSEYQTARAKLGAVEVTPATAPPAASGSASPGAVDPFAAVGPARKVPGAYVAPGTPLADRPWFWAALVGAPLVVLLAQGSAGALLGLRQRRRDLDASASARSKKALEEARAAEASGDRRAAAAAVERSVVIAVEGATGLKLRALLRDQIAPALGKHGLSQADADAVVSLLDTCEQERFVPDAAPGAERLSARAEPLIRSLLRGGRS